MAVGGGVRVASSVEVWGRGLSGGGGGSRAGRRGAAAAAVRCSCVGEAGPASGGLAEEHYRTLRLRPGATRGEVKKAFRRLALMVRFPADPATIFHDRKRKKLPFSTPHRRLIFTIYRGSKALDSFPFHHSDDVSIPVTSSFPVRRPRAVPPGRPQGERRRRRRPVPEDQRGLSDADEQHEGGRGAARVLAAQVRPQRPGSRQVQVLPQRGRRRLARHVKKLTQPVDRRRIYTARLSTLIILAPVDSCCCHGRGSSTVISSACVY